MSPEKIEQKDGYDFKSDVWALGITAYEIVTGSVPYQDLPPMKALMTIFNSEPPTLNKYENWSNEFRYFVYDCLQKDASRRVSAEDIISKHRKFFMKARDNSYIQQHLIKGLEPLLDRVPPKVRALG